MARHRADVAALSHIATILIDARRLYARAARFSEDVDIVSRIERTIGERAHLLTDVEERMREMGGKPPTDGSMLGAAHMAFFDVRSLFERDEKAALAEIERGEKYLRDEIRKAIRDDTLGAETRAFLGLTLDRIVSGEMRIEGKIEEIEHLPQRGGQSDHTQRHH